MRSRNFFLILMFGIGLFFVPEAKAWYYTNFRFPGGDLYSSDLYSPYVYVNPPVAQSYYYYDYGYPRVIAPRHFYYDYPRYYYYPHRYRHFYDGGYRHYYYRPFHGRHYFGYRHW